MTESLADNWRLQRKCGFLMFNAFMHLQLRGVRMALSNCPYVVDDGQQFGHVNFSRIAQSCKLPEQCFLLPLQSQLPLKVISAQIHVSENWQCECKELRQQTSRHQPNLLSGIKRWTCRCGPDYHCLLSIIAIKMRSASCSLIFSEQRINSSGLLFLVPPS